MKKGVLFVFLWLLAGCLFPGCAGELKFELDAAVYYREVWQGERFVVVVTTENVGRTYRYRGSSTIVGAAAELYCETPDGVFYLICVLRACRDDGRRDIGHDPPWPNHHAGMVF